MSDQASPSAPKPGGSERKGWWGWIVGAFAAASAIVAWSLANGPKLEEIYQEYFLPLLSDEFTLRTARQVYHRPMNANDYEVVVEVVASKKSLQKCQADLDIGPGINYPKGEDKTDDRDARNGFKRFNFAIPKKDYPDRGAIRLRCEKAVSDWKEVDWPIDVKKQDFGLVIGSDDSHGVPRLHCGTDIIAWAKREHPDVCKFVQKDEAGVTDGGQCGFTHYVVRCSTVPFQPGK